MRAIYTCIYDSKYVYNIRSQIYDRQCLKHLCIKKLGSYFLLSNSCLQRAIFLSRIQPIVRTPLHSVHTSACILLCTQKIKHSLFSRTVTHRTERTHTSSVLVVRECKPKCPVENEIDNNAKRYFHIAQYNAMCKNHLALENMNGPYWFEGALMRMRSGVFSDEKY